MLSPRSDRRRRVVDVDRVVVGRVLVGGRVGRVVDPGGAGPRARAGRGAGTGHTVRGSTGGAGRGEARGARGGGAGVDPNDLDREFLLVDLLADDRDVVAVANRAGGDADCIGEVQRDGAVEVANLDVRARRQGVDPDDLPLGLRVIRAGRRVL